MIIWKVLQTNTNNEITDGGEVPGAVTDGAGNNVGTDSGTQALTQEYPPEQQVNGTDGGYQNAYPDQGYNNQQVILQCLYLQYELQ